MNVHNSYDNRIDQGYQLEFFFQYFSQPAITHLHVFLSKGQVTLRYGLTQSHAEGAKAPHRESAPVSVGERLLASVSVRDRTFPCVTFRGKRVHPSAATNQLLVQKFVALGGCLRGLNHPRISVETQRDGVHTPWTSYIHRKYRWRARRSVDQKWLTLHPSLKAQSHWGTL